MSKPKFLYDGSKGMWYRYYSECCGAAMEQKMLYKGKIAPPDFKLYTTEDVKLYTTVKRKWWQLWRPKKKEVQDGVITKTFLKPVVYRDFCKHCGKQAKGEHEFIFEDRTPKLNPNKEQEQ